MVIRHARGRRFSGLLFIVRSEALPPCRAPKPLPRPKPFAFAACPFPLSCGSYPTIAELAGVPLLVPLRGGEHVDGVSLLPWRTRAPQHDTTH